MRKCPPSFYFSLKHQLVKRGNVLREKLSARNEKQNSQALKTYRKSLLAKPLWLALTDGTICSWGLRVAFLSNPKAVVAGCELCCPRRNPNWHIVFVCALHEQRAPVVSCWKSLKIQINFTYYSKQQVYFSRGCKSLPDRSGQVIRWGNAHKY